MKIINPENKDFHILVVDDEIEYQRAFSLILSRQGFHVLTCSDGQTALEMLAENEIDLVMTDLKMPGMDGLTLIQKVKEAYPSIELMIITAFGSIESAVQAMKYGATGYFIKSSDPESLLLDINRMVRIKSLEKSNQIFQQQQNEDTDLFLDSKTPAFLEVLETCQKAASSGINVLLLGESGVGKEVFANYIHRLSDRSHHHLIPVNCQVFGEGTIESELFGHEKGSFTGAVGRRIGRFEEANHGTLFLDEIGDLPLSVQGKLLRTLETRTIERVGSNRPIELNLRLICATNKDLQKEIADLKDFVARNKARVATRNMAMSRQKKLDKMDVIELAAERPKPEFQFLEARTPGRFPFITRELVIGYDEPLSKPLNLTMERGKKIVITGANGIGKTTLLKSILGITKSLKGSVELGDYLEIGYFEQESSKGADNTCIEEIWSEFPGFSQYEVRSALAKCGLTTKHIESLCKVLSGGEQAKVRLCKLINKETNLLLLDEPTNHLDVDAKEELKRALKAYKGSILMVCHEPEFYDGLATDVWDCSKWTTKLI